MNRKILGICTALAAFAAFAVVPTVASASPELTHPTLSRVAVNTKITAIAETHSVLGDTSANELVTCDATEDHTWLTGTVVKNNGTQIEGTIESAKFQADTELTKCHSGLLGPTKVDIPGLTNEGGTQHYCLKNSAGDNWELKPANCGAAGGAFTFILTGSLTCYYSRTAAITGTFTTTHPGTLTVNTTAFTREAPSSVFCPASGQLEKLTLRIYTDKATFAESTANPVAIS